MIRKAKPQPLPGAETAARFSDWLNKQADGPATSNLWWYPTLILGIMVALFGVILLQTFPATTQSAHPGYGSPVLAFEFVRNESDLFAVFGAPDDPMRAERLEAMRTGIERDFLFILLYASFLIAGLVALWRELGLRIILAAVALPILAAICDAYENFLMIDIQAAFSVGDYSLAIRSLPWAVAVKFLALTGANLVIAYALGRMAGWWRLAGTLIAVPCLATIMALIAPQAFGWTLNAAVGAGWIGLLGVAAIGSYYAAIRRRPLVDFSLDIPLQSARKPSNPADEEQAEITAPAPALRSFGRRQTSEDA